MPARPGLFFYRDAWDSEPGLAVCSEGAQYLWFKILLLMNESEPRGFLLLNGRQPTPKQVAALTRTDPEQVEARILELEESGVFSRNRNGVIYSRRMVREEKKARIARENGKLGGNPTLCKPRPIPPSDNQSGKGGDKPLNSELPSSEPREEDSYLPAAESPTPRARPKDGAGAPEAADAELRSSRAFIDKALLMNGANPATTRKRIMAWVDAYGPAITELGLATAIVEAKTNLANFTSSFLEDKVNKRAACIEAAKAQATAPEEPDPIAEASRLFLETCNAMETHDAVH